MAQLKVLCISSFEEIEALGTTVLSKTPNADDVKDKMKKLDDDQRAINELFKKRSRDLEDAYNLAVSHLMSSFFCKYLEQ